MDINITSIKNPLTRTSGYLESVTSHSLQPYRGCPLGSSLCGVGCYVQHNRWLTAGRPWGSFLDVRADAYRAYLEHAHRERVWARKKHGAFSIFLSSSTEPFPPQEARYGATRKVLEAMLSEPPDELVIQTHSHRVVDQLALLLQLAEKTRLRAHVSVETDRERIPGLPAPGSSISRRLEAARTLREAGIFTVLTVSPLLPMEDPEAFFRRVSDLADAVVVDHFVGGDGSADGRRTLATPLPAAMEALHPGSSSLAYRDHIVAIAQRVFAGPVGISIDGFAGRYLADLFSSEQASGR